MVIIRLCHHYQQLHYDLSHKVCDIVIILQLPSSYSLSVLNLIMTRHITEFIPQTLDHSLKKILGFLGFKIDHGRIACAVSFQVCYII